MWLDAHFSREHQQNARGNICLTPTVDWIPYLIKLNSLLQEFDEECNDVTNDLPKGASSIVVPKDTEAWQVFTEISFRGATVELEPGKRYKSPTEMGLQDPMKSFRKVP